MKRFFINGAMDPQLLQRFIDFTNENADYDWSIVINSNGGDYYIARLIADIINEREQPAVEVIAICNIQSAAFEFFKLVKCTRKIVKATRGMIHQGYSKDVYIQENGEVMYSTDKCLIKNNKEILWADSQKEWKPILTEKEWRRYKKGDDVQFGYKRMRELFPDAKEI